MAHVYIRPGSRYFWIKKRDAAGKVVRQSTGIPHGSPDNRRKAKRLEADATQKELAFPRRRRITEHFTSWAADYLATRYAGKGDLKSAKTAFTDLLAYFKERDIAIPRQVTYDVANGFIPWRTSHATLTRVAVNTARLRFVYFSVLMAEAVRRGLADHNPCRDVERPREAPAKKLEITSDDQAKIEAALVSRPQWMRDQWLIMMRHGCRIAETVVPLERIDLERGTITFRVKGGKLHTTKLHPDLRPLVERSKAEGRSFLIEGPPASSHSAAWCVFFSSLGLPYSAHCCRVTVITRLLRANHSSARVAAFIGHSEEINVIYRRLHPDDTTDLLQTLAAPSNPSPSSPLPADQDKQQ